MDRPERDTAGDYGYDLVHDDVQAVRRPDPPVRREPAPPAKRAGAEAGGDLEYDEAHDF